MLSWTDIICLFKLNLSAKFLRQTLHSKLFTCSWTDLICLCMKVGKQKILSKCYILQVSFVHEQTIYVFSDYILLPSQISHMKEIATPWTVVICLSKLALLAKVTWQISQSNVIFLWWKHLICLLMLRWEANLQCIYHIWITVSPWRAL